MRKLLVMAVFTSLLFGGNLESDLEEGILQQGRGNLTKAMELYTKTCDGGLSLGCQNLGMMYKNGQGTKQDNTKAADLFTKGCEGGNARSCHNLGSMYEAGQGVKQDMQKR